ncbi:hypothetical protein P2318_09695 [Myxococcaceae bacterium GXIMD 01537]
MHPLLRCLALAGVVLLFGCGGYRQALAEKGYLQQQLYDYAYDVPLNDLWAEAKAVTDSSGRGEKDTEGVRTLTVFRGNGQTLEPGASGFLLRGWEAEGRTYLHIFRLQLDEPPPPPSDLGARAADLELKLVERFRPEDARRFQEGARQAALRAR